MVQTLELRATQDGVIWPRRPLVSSNGLLSCIQNLPHSSYDKRPTHFRAVAFNSSGELLAVSDEKGRLFVLFVTANRYALVRHLGVPTIRCCFSPLRKSELLVTCEDETVRCIDAQSQTLISTLRGHRYPARCASFQKSGHLALTASQDAVILWDTKDWSRYRVLNAGPGVEEAMFVSKGDLVAVCFQDDTIMMWELETLTLRYRFSLPEREDSPGLRKIAVSEDHQVLVASGRAPFIYVWEFESQTIIRIIELPLPIKQVVSHAFLPGHSTMISILGDDGSVFFLDVAAKNPQIKLEIANRGRAISAFDIECHARYLAALTSDGFLLLYDMEIARETAARVQERRRKEGLPEGNRSRLHTRSGLEEVYASDSADPKRNAMQTAAPEQSRPVPSKLIDSLFGVKYSRRSNRTPNRTQADATTAGLTESPRSRSMGATRIHGNANPSIVKVKQTRKFESTLRDRSPTNRANPLSRSPAQLTAQEIDVNRKRLVGSLKSNGMYPKKYRVLVWRFLLRLPKNEEGFRTLVAKGKHPVFVRLKDQYPLQNARIFRRLHRVLSAIVYWCPAFGEVSYLPAVVYPFVKIFRENDLAAFEASISVLLHWCGDFLVSLPYPPVFAMGAIEKELAQRDGQLFDHFTRYQVTSEAFAWSLLKTIFTEVLSEDEWMCLWDHLFTFPDTPQLLFVAVLAYLCYFRTALLAACDRFSIEQFFHQQNAIDIEKFVQLMMNLRDKLDLSEFTAIEDPGAADSASGTHGPFWPLARGQYPAFAHYPRFVVDFQIGERNRIALEEAELSHKQSLLDQIEEESKKLKTEHDKWLKERQLVLKAEERRKKEAIDAEKERILRLKTLDYETRKRRLQYLSNMETAAHQTLEEASRMLQSEFQRLESTLEMQKERMEFEISSRKQEEDLQRIEFETHDRVQGIHKQREMEERLLRLRTEFETRVKQQELQDLLKFESWKRDDEEQARKAKLKLRRREELALLSQEKRVRQELENQLLDQQLAKDKELLELETARRARRQEQLEHDELNCDTEGEEDEDHFFLEQHSKKSNPYAQHSATNKPSHRSRDLSGHEVLNHKVETSGRDIRNSSDQFSDNDSDTDNEDTARRWNIPSGENIRVRNGDENVSPPRFPTKFTIQTPPQRPASSDSGSSVSFASASMRRTMAEMSLLEKALGNISSSGMSSSSGSAGSGEDPEENAPVGVGARTISSTRRAEPSRTGIHLYDEVQNETQDFVRATTAELEGHSIQAKVQRQAQGVRRDITAQSSITTSQGAAELQQTHGVERTTTAQNRVTIPPRGDVINSPQNVIATPPHAVAATQDALMTPPQSFRETSQTPDEHPAYFPPEDAVPNDAEHVAEASTHHTDVNMAAGDKMNESSSSSEDFSSSNVMDALQRPIAELEKKLGIRFDDFSDEEKEDESDVDPFEAGHESDDDETIEDDRAKLLQRAKKLLEMESFDSDSDVDLSI